jgi:hypothetical protein
MVDIVASFKFDKNLSFSDLNFLGKSSGCKKRMIWGRGDGGIVTRKRFKVVAERPWGGFS